jgi:hypothetical protein
MVKKQRPPIAPPLSPDEAKAVMDKLDRVFDEFGGPKLSDTGDVNELEQALGMYLLGRHLGWKVLVLLHNKRTIRKYEEILDISIREEFPEIGPAANRSVGYRVAETLSNFWKAVSGEVSIPDRRKISNG